MGLKHYFLSTIILISTPSYAGYNERLKLCLDEAGYTPDQFYYFPFTKVNSCVQEFMVMEELARQKKTRIFLDSNPEYTGPNYRWAEQNNGLGSTLQKRY